MELKQRAKEIGLINEKLLMPSKRQIEWYNREKMIFFHFGMNTFTGREWGDGSESPSTFNPTELDVYQWVSIIKKAGFKCAILTAKHHDGFCLWQTKYTEHSIKNSPYKNGKGDIVKEFTDACKSLGIKAGIYLSPWDRHEKSWGKEEYNDFYVGQLTELLTNYGKIWEVWWDGAGSTEAVYDWARWAKTVRELAPDATIFGSLGATPYVDVRWVGNEKGVAGKPCYATIDHSSLEKEITSELNKGCLDGDAFIPAEVDVSIRPGWFYHSEQDNEVRSPQNLMKLWFTSNGSNAGLLLNLPPDKRGLIHENDVKALLDFNSILEDSFKENLIKGAKITSPTTYEGCDVKSILNDDNTFFAPSKNDEISIEIELDYEIDFNAFVIKEGIEVGHRVTDFELFAEINGENKSIHKGNCIGYKCAEYFNKIRTKKLLLKTKGSLDTPIIKFFGVYLINKEIIEEIIETCGVKNLFDATSVIEKDNNRIDINLGGVKAFNRVKLNGVKNGEYKLYIFNGSSFELLKEGECVGSVAEIAFETIDYAYRLLIEAPLNENAQVEIYKLSNE